MILGQVVVGSAGFVTSNAAPETRRECKKEVNFFSLDTERTREHASSSRDMLLRRSGIRHRSKSSERLTRVHGSLAVSAMSYCCSDGSVGLWNVDGMGRVDVTSVA